MSEPTRPHVSYARILKALEREAAMRVGFYARKVTSGQMSQQQADEEVACIESAAQIMRDFQAILGPLQDAAKLDRGPKKDGDDFVACRFPRHLMQKAAALAEVDHTGQSFFAL